MPEPDVYDSTSRRAVKRLRRDLDRVYLAGHLAGYEAGELAASHATHGADAAGHDEDAIATKHVDISAIMEALGAWFVDYTAPLLSGEIDLPDDSDNVDSRLAAQVIKLSELVFGKAPTPGVNPFAKSPDDE